MALRNIRYDGDEILRKVSKPVTEINEGIRTLIEDMCQTMRQNEGVGLAAPQVGILKRVIVVDVGQGPIILINPEMIHQEGEQIGAEGCLSIPGVWGEVKRPNKVKVKGLNKDGKEVVIEGEGILARVICHEIDHLNGILFKDKVIKYIETEGKKRK